MALKASSSTQRITETENSSSESESDDEDVGMLARKFRKFLRRKNSGDGQKSNFKGKKHMSKAVCYNCKTSGHFIADCKKPIKEGFLNFKSKEAHKKKEYKPYNSNFKRKKKRFVVQRSRSDSEESSKESENEED